MERWTSPPGATRLGFCGGGRALRSGRRKKKNQEKRFGYCSVGLVQGKRVSDRREVCRLKGVQKKGGGS